MATLVKHGNQYLSRIRVWNGVRQLTTTVPLRTNKSKTAKERHLIVQKEEKSIKTGDIQKHQFKDFFEWLNGKGTSTLKPLTCKEASLKFLDKYKVEQRKYSYKRMVISLNRFFDVVTENKAIREISIRDIDNFKERWNGTHKKAGINLNLRNIKTFLYWCRDYDIIEKAPKITMLREEKKQFKYINEQQMKDIMNLDSVSPFFKKVIYLYYSTGCRRSELIEGKLNGNVLNIPAHLSKSSIEQDIPLDDIQASIVKEIHSRRDKHLSSGKQMVTFKNKFTYRFNRICKKLKLDEGISFHSLRHTFAVTNWITSNDIYEVSKLLNHTSVKTTERYAKFKWEALRLHFPTAYKVRLEIEEIRKKAISTQIISTQMLQMEESSS